MYFISCLIVLSACFVSCDGRYKQKDSQKIAVKNFIEANKNLESITLVPQYPIEIITDTIISAHTKVHIKTKTSDNDLVKVRNKSQSDKKIIAYRKLESYVEIINDNQLIFSETIDSEMFINTSDVFWKYAILESVWVNEFESNKEEVFLDIVFKNPTTKNYKFFNLFVQKDGNYTINPV